MEKSKLEVYDPPMCCSSGVCGSNVNPELVKFSADLDWLKKQNVQIERFSLSSNPAAFTQNESVKEALKNDGNKCLPMVLANGVIISKGSYPSRDELKSLLGIELDDTGVEVKPDAAYSVGCDCVPSGCGQSSEDCN